MMAKLPRVKGVYVSYNEEQGLLDEIILNSKSQFILWLDASSFNMNRFSNLGKNGIPFYIRIKGEERYYKAKLIKVTPSSNLSQNYVSQNSSYRPEPWKSKDKSMMPKPVRKTKTKAKKNMYRSVLRVSNLSKLNLSLVPSEIRKSHPPQRPKYIYS
jgi:hypothetical protein